MNATRFFAAYFLVMLIVGVFAVSMSLKVKPYVDFSNIIPANAVPRNMSPNKFALALEDPDFGVPLDTGSIGLMAYYYRYQGFILNDSVPAWDSYTEHGSDGVSYYDGYIKIWMDVNGTTYTGTDFSFLVACRLRADGWVLAWLTTSQNASLAPVWGHTRVTAGSPIQNCTSPIRAIERIYYVAGLTFPGYTNIKMYDYQNPTATKLVIIGQSKTTPGPTGSTWFASIPSSTNAEIVDGYTSIGWYELGGGDDNFTINGVTKFAMFTSNDPQGWSGVDVKSSLSFDTTLTFRVVQNINAFSIAVIVWLR